MLEKKRICLTVVINRTYTFKKILSIPLKHLNPSLTHFQYYFSGCIMFNQMLSVRKYKKKLLNGQKKWVMKDISWFLNILPFTMLRFPVSLIQ